MTNKLASSPDKTDEDRALAAARKRIETGKSTRQVADTEVKRGSVDAVRILAGRRFPDALSVEFHKDYNEDSFTLFRVNDSDGDPIWEVYDALTQSSDTKAQKYLDAEMNALMKNVGAEAKRFLPEIKEMIGETVVFRF